jgi:ferredoxin
LSADENNFLVELPSGKEVHVSKDKDLRTNLKDHFNELYHPNMKLINCRGMGTCGTCALVIKGNVTPPTKIEEWRLNFPPHKNSLEKNIRLLCQCRPLSNLSLKKLNGRWGQGD